MLAIPNALENSNDINILDKLLISVKIKLERLFAQKEIYKIQSRINESFLTLMKFAHEANADIESLRDAIDIYYINDITEDEKILQVFAEMLSQRTEMLEAILDVIEELEPMPNNANENLYRAFDELYSNIVNTNFDISQKLASAYLDTQSNTELLKGA